MKKLLLLLTLALCAPMSFAQNVPSYVSTDGLVGYWPFNGNANDESGNGNNGTVNGATLTSDRFGNTDKAYSFNGINNSISVSNSQQLLNLSNFSYSTWVYTDINTPADGLVICSYDGNSRGALLYCNTNSSEIRIHSNSNIDISALTKSNTLSMSWHHIVVVKSNNELKMYLDNLLMDTIDISNFNYATSSIYPLTFGKASWYNGGYYNGKIDDIAIYNRALTQDEITAIYNGVEYSDTCNAVSGSLTNGLVGYWPFCGNANDDSGHGNNGTVNGATLTTDRFGNSNSAYSFDGNSIVSVANNASLNIQQPSGQITVSVWAYKTTDATGGHIIGKRTLCSSFQYQIGFNVSPFGVGWGGQNCYLENVLLVFPTYEWIHYVGTYDGNTWKLYKNATLVGSLTASLPPLVADDLIFGGSGTCTKFIGKIDDIGIWNRALTQQEITQLYNQNQCMTSITVTDTMIINVGQLSYTNPIYYANNITLYPNPANTQVNISFNNITDLTGGQIHIINSLGQQVATTPITLSGTNTTIPLTTWGGAGLYFVQILNAQGIVVDVKKIILQ